MAAFNDLLSAGAPSFATWVAIGNNYSAEMIGSAGYDCVVLDTQHGAVTWDQLGGLIQAVDLSGTPSLVRVGGVDTAQIMRALDLGAAGVIVPMVSTVEEARQAVAAMHYPPEGLRSFGKVRNYYGASANSAEAAAPLCFVMIETAQAMQNLEAIAAVDGVDGLFVGPVDLGLGLGLGTILEPNEAVFDAIAKIAAAAKSQGKVAASASFSTAYTQTLLERGVQFIVQGSDMGFIRRGAAESIDAFRSLVAETGAATAKQ